jgi:alkanesulfonate monooxygenase SsuD/methylene tetrahydromethanopterin reductase-like flavin-dependent oxidoreductase (luciferase family)
MAAHLPRIGVYFTAPDDASADEIIERARAADAQGFDTFWLPDHLTDYRGTSHVSTGPFDSFTLMVAIGASTQRIRLAWGMLNVTFRNPAVLAKMLATLDHVTHGRVICSVGAGWLKSEYDAYGLTFIEDHEERIAHEREVIQLLKELWTRPAPERVTFEGRYVHTNELPFNPAPYQTPHPPVWVGGDSDATLALARDEGDGWVPIVRSERDALRRLRDAGRRPERAVRCPHVQDHRGRDTAAGGRGSAPRVRARRGRALQHRVRFRGLPHTPDRRDAGGVPGAAIRRPERRHRPPRRFV